MSEDQPEELVQPTMVVSSDNLDEDDLDYAEDFASASGPGVLFFRIIGSEAAPYPGDTPASLRGLLEAARGRGCRFLVIETDGGGAMLPGFPVREG